MFPLKFKMSFNVHLGAIQVFRNCNIVFISDKINTRVVSNIIEQEVSTPETVKDTFG